MNITITTIPKSEYFRSLFQYINLFTEQINILFKPDQVFIQSMDSAKVSIFELAIPAAWFDSYIFPGEDTIILGLSSTILFKILTARERDQTMNITYNNEDEDKLFINYTNETGFDKHFEMPLIDIENEMMDIPQIEYQAEFSLPSTNFASIVNQLKMFGETMDMQCSEDKIMLYSQSQTMGKMSVEIKIDDLTAFSIDEGDELKLSFSLTSLHNVCMYNKLASEIEIKIKTDFPIKLIYSLGEDNIKMTFYLAPKMLD